MVEIIHLDKKDRKILYQLDINPRKTNSEIGKAVRLTKDIVNYRIKQLESRGVIRWYGAVTNTYKLGILKIKVYLVLQNESKEKRKEIVSYFCSHVKTEWVAEMSGRWDLTIGYLVNDIYEFNEALFDFLQKYGKYVNEKALTIALGVYHFKKDWLLFNTRKRHLEVYQGGKKQDIKVDKFDNELLKILTNNARLPLVKIADILSQSPQAVKYRLEQLKKKGIITTSKVFIDLAKIGKLFYKSHIYLKEAREKRVSELISYCESKPEITYIIRNLGAWEIELEFEIDSFENFYKVMEEIKQEFSDIIKEYDYVIIIKDHKWDYYSNCYKPSSL